MKHLSPFQMEAMRGIVISPPVLNAGLRQVEKQRDSFSGKQGTGTDTGLLKFILGGDLETSVGREVPWFPRLRMFNAGWRQGGAV